jgi:hypothetical protein
MYYIPLVVSIFPHAISHEATNPVHEAPESYGTIDSNVAARCHGRGHHESLRSCTLLTQGVLSGS